MQDKGYFMKAKAKSHQLDMLHGSIWNKLPRFALPVAATAILEQLFNASDVAVVGNFAGDAAEKTAAVAAVGANTAIIGLIVNLFVGIALGANVVIANAIGRDDKDAVHRAVHTSILVALLGGAAIAVIGELIAGTLLHSLNVPDDVYPLALLYLRIYLLGMPVILLYNFEAAIFRSIGDTKVPLIALACSGVLNVILNLFFVAVLGMTVNGVAIATVISNALSSLILFIRLIRTDKYIKLEPRSLRIDGQSMKLILKIGLPAGIQSAVFSLSNIVIQSAINSLGKVVMAASSAALNIELLAYYVLNSFSQACTTFVGQNYGAGKYDRVRKSIRVCIGMDFAAAILLMLVLVCFRIPLFHIFVTDENVVEIGLKMMATMAPFYWLFVFTEVFSGALRGMGDVVVPMLITTGGICLFRVVWIFGVVALFPTLTVTLLNYPVSWVLTSVLFLFYYHFRMKKLTAH